MVNCNLKRGVIVLGLIIQSVLRLYAADFYWIKGGGNWSDPAHWSLSSGGSSAFLVPLPTDNVIFDVNSGFTVASRVVNLDSPHQYCNNMTWVGALNNPVIQGDYQSNLLNIFGSLTLQSGMSYHVGTTYFKSNIAGQTIRTNGTRIGATSGSTFQGNFVFNGSGSWILLDDLTMGGGTSSAGNIILEKGTLNTNGKKLDIAYFLSTGSEVRSVSLGSSNITVRYQLYGWRYVGTNKILNSGTSHIYITADMSYDNTSYGLSGALNDVYHYVTYTNPLTTIGNFSGGVRAKKVTFMGNAKLTNSNTFDTLVFVNGGKYFFERGSVQTINHAFYPSGSPCISTELADFGSGALPKIVVLGGSVNYDFIISKNINATGSLTSWSLGPLSTDLGGNTNMNFDPSAGSSALAGLGPDMLNLPCKYTGTLNVNGFYPNPSSSFLWNTGATSSSIPVDSFGTYSVTVTYSSTCIVSDAITLAPHDSCSSPLPVSLSNFSVENESCVNHLSWSTFSESNNAYFEVYRSPNADSWELIHTAQGAGNSNSLQYYSFDDPLLAQGNYYYYLKQVDYNGRSEVFPMQFVSVKNCQAAISVYPNPVTDFVNLKWEPSQFEVSFVEVVDITGRTILNVAVSDFSGNMKLNLAHLPAGVYCMNVKSANNEITTHKIVVNK